MDKDIAQKILDKLDQFESRIIALENTNNSAHSIMPLDNSSVKSGKETLVMKIVNKITDCEENEAIRSMVLDKKSQEAKLLLCLYISYKYFANEWLTSGDMEKITSELGIKIDKGNISNKLTSMRQYLESGSMRKKGQATPYRLNRKGIKRFEEILRTT